MNRIAGTTVVLNRLVVTFEDTKRESSTYRAEINRGKGTTLIFGQDDMDNLFYLVERLVPGIVLDVPDDWPEVRVSIPKDPLKASET